MTHLTKFMAVRGPSVDPNPKHSVCTSGTLYYLQTVGVNTLHDELLTLMNPNIAQP
jgi:hypothetical protein